jgi:hypothetical protein
MRFLYKRQPAEELQLEIRDVRHAMSSGGLVLFDLLFYSFIFALLIMPIKAGYIVFMGYFSLIYFTFACIFLFIRKLIDDQQFLKDFWK